MTSTKPLSCRELVVQIAGIPEEGIHHSGSLPLDSLDLELEPDRFDTSNALLTFSLHLQPVKSDIIVTGSIHASLLAQCDRCAELAPLHLEDTEIFHEYKNLTGDPIDLTEDLREDILMTFPQSFLCSEDCKGICPVCGQNRNLHPCDCQKAAEIPFESEEENQPKESNPWAALDQLSFKE